MARHTVFHNPIPNVFGIVLTAILCTLVAAAGLTVFYFKMEGYRADHTKKDVAAKTYTRDEFRSLVIGKTPEQVIAAVGRPGDAINDRDGTPRTWSYHGIVRNETTHAYGWTHLRFEDGIVSEVRQ